MPGREARWVLLPPGQDPDDLIRAGGAGAMRAVRDQAQPLADLVVAVPRAGEGVTRLPSASATPSTTSSFAHTWVTFALPNGESHSPPSGDLSAKP